MANTVIKIENVGKRYLINHLADKREQLFSRLLANKVKSVFRHGRKVLSASTSQRSPIMDSREEFWALKDVSFEITKGDRVGIIGRNGAGKSTLLKILSRITEPTTGKITIDGRIASLLEVGTGFHSELSGRENIYLNGAILGMGREEIRRKFDEIVAFAEVERFLDTPVKRYSSGMYVRLAFAVAAHLEPEILIVDEVLAVGDAQFQKKCLGKMEDVSAKEGRTVLFVSHNMAMIQSLCNTGILMRKGKISYHGSVGGAIHQYNTQLVNKDEGVQTNQSVVHVTDIRIIHIDKDEIITPESQIQVEVEFITPYLLPNCYLNLVIEDSERRALIHSRTDLFDFQPTFKPGKHSVKIRIGRLSLTPGIYSVWFRLFCNSNSVYECVDSEPLMLDITGKRVGGFVDVPCQWVVDEEIC